MKRPLTTLVLAGFTSISGCSGLPVVAADRAGRDLGAQVAPCPPPPQQGPGTESIVLEAASGVASTLVGAAVDAVVSYLTQVRAVRSTASLALQPADEIALLEGGQCLYLFASTRALQTLIREENKGTLAAIPLALIKQIEAKSLTPFFAVLSFFPAQVADGSNRYYRPNVLSWIYSSFLDDGCPAFRNCSRRDVAIVLKFARPLPADGSLPSSRGYPLSVAFANVRPREVTASLVNNFGSSQAALSLPGGPGSLWFAYDGSGGAISNLEFSMTETSRPGRLAEALASILKTKKQQIQSALVAPLVPVPPAQRKTLVESAMEEYTAYANAHLIALNLFAQGVETPEKRGLYRLSREKAMIQMKIAQAAWVAAKIPNAFETLPVLPSP